MTLSSVGVPFLVLFDAYECYFQSLDRQFVGGAEARRRTEHLGCMVQLLGSWVSSAQKNSFAGDQAKTNAAKLELSRAVASGRLMSRVDGLKSKLETLPDADRLLDRLRTIEETISYAI
jgi:hypothetical protein